MLCYTKNIYLYCILIFRMQWSLTKFIITCILSIRHKLNNTLIRHPSFKIKIQLVYILIAVKILKWTLSFVVVTFPSYYICSQIFSLCSCRHYVNVSRGIIKHFSGHSISKCKLMSVTYNYRGVVSAFLRDILFKRICIDSRIPRD